MHSSALVAIILFAAKSKILAFIITIYITMFSFLEEPRCFYLMIDARNFNL